MRPAIELTSVPAWAVSPCRQDADVSGRYWTVLAFDAAGPGPTADVVADWLAQIETRHPGATPRVHRVGDDAAAVAALAEDLTTALVGWRLMIVGPADACLRLRAHAIRHHVGDDEITVATVDVAHRDVRCAHCGTTTRAAVELEGIVPCLGCGRNLVVYYHVSRRAGAHLGIMSDEVVAR
jgi:hypothetical protein